MHKINYTCMHSDCTCTCMHMYMHAHVHACMHACVHGVAWLHANLTGSTVCMCEVNTWKMKVLGP